MSKLIWWFLSLLSVGLAADILVGQKLAHYSDSSIRNGIEAAIKAGFNDFKYWLVKNADASFADYAEHKGVADFAAVARDFHVITDNLF